MFNADNFLAQATKSATATTTLPIPPAEYLGQIHGLKARVNKDNSVVMDVTWEIPDANLQEQLKRKQVFTRQSIWLDVDEAGNLMEGDGVNVQLGKLRKAVGQNNDGEAWSPNQLIGAVATIVVVADVNKETGDVGDKVRSVAPRA